MSKRQIVAMGGGGFSMEPRNPLLDDYALGLVSKPKPRICLIPTAGGDSENYIQRFHSAFEGRAEPTHLSLFRRQHRDLRKFVLSQDLVYVGGGNTANLLAIWRLHGLDSVLREAWDAGVILCGVSAGALCWFESGVTDSFGAQLSSITNGLGLLKGSFCPHYDGEALRRPTLKRLISEGLAAGIAADDGAALHFVDGELEQVVSSRRNARAFRVETGQGGVIETPLTVRFLGAARSKP